MKFLHPSLNRVIACNQSLDAVPIPYKSAGLLPPPGIRLCRSKRRGEARVVPGFTSAFSGPPKTAFTSNPQTKTYPWGPRLRRMPLGSGAFQAQQLRNRCSRRRKYAQPIPALRSPPETGFLRNPARRGGAGEKKRPVKKTAVESLTAFSEILYPFQLCTTSPLPPCWSRRLGFPDSD